MGRTFFFRGQGQVETKSSEKEFDGIISCMQGSGRKMGLMYRLRSWTLVERQWKSKQDDSLKTKKNIRG